MSAPKQPSSRENEPIERENEPIENVPPQHQLDPVNGPDGDSGGGDQDIDTAGTEADTEPSSASGPSSRSRGRAAAPDASLADAPENEHRPIGAHDPGTMHRREDDAEAMAHSPDFHGRPVIDRHR